MTPNGWLCDDCGLWELGQDWVISKGFEAMFPDLSTSNIDQWLGLESGIRKLAKSILKDERLQVSMHSSSEFKELDGYDVASQGPMPEICRSVRQELSDYFRERMRSGSLIRSNVRIYLSTKVRARSKKAFSQLLPVVKQAFEQRGSYFDLGLRGMGGWARPMTDMDHYRDMLRYWTPNAKPKEEIDTRHTLHDLCRHSDVSPRMDQGFCLDGLHHSVFVTKAMPVASMQKTMEPFTDLAIPGLNVTVNMFPLSVSDEIRHERDRHKKLSRNAPVDLGSAEGMEPHALRVRNLQRLQVVPFMCQLIVALAAQTAEDLRDKMEAVRTAIDQCGFTAQNVNLQTSAIQYFNRATPGFGPWWKYKGYEHKLDDQHLAHIWPITSTPIAELDGADWISCGDRKNLIGGKMFTGHQPKNWIVVGNTGSGKTAIVQESVLQVAHIFQLIGIMDDGGERGTAWMETCRLLDPTCKPIIIDSNSGHTFNLLDTKGMALSAQHKRSAIAFSHVLVGESDDKDRDAERVAIIAKVIDDIYQREYDHWKREYPVQHFKACRRTFLAKRVDQSFVDAVQMLKNDPRIEEYEEAVTEDEAMAIDREDEQNHLVRDASFSLWTPEMFPTLMNLQDEINARRSDSLHHQPLANQLNEWLRGGGYGPIVDGVSNIDLGTSYIKPGDPLKVVLFELGAAAKSGKRLKAIVGYLIANEFRNVIQNMPRWMKKALIIEEMTSFLRVPNSSEIIIDYAERMRKYSCWLVYIFQQYSSLLKADASVAEAIIGNSLAMMLMQTNNHNELEVLSRYMDVPEPVKAAIFNMPPPESLQGKNAYSGFVYVDKAGNQPKFTVGRKMISQRVEKIIRSSGNNEHEMDAFYSGASRSVQFNTEAFRFNGNGKPDVRLAGKPA